ncbi:type II toxin-antitoxin system VapC family toxin [Hydrogenimonas sp.]
MIWFLDTNICLDLLDTTRPGSSDAVAWYMAAKERVDDHFCFFGDAVTTIFYVLSERRNVDRFLVLEALAAMIEEIEPVYVNHGDFIAAKSAMEEGVSEDFEDLMMLSAAARRGAERLVTNDRKLRQMKRYEEVAIVSLEEVGRL